MLFEICYENVPIKQVQNIYSIIDWYVWKYEMMWWWKALLL